MKKRYAIATVLVVLLVVQSVFACFTTGVGRLASADGSTMTSHTCDSTGDDLRLWLIPSMAEGTERDVVVNGRKNSDFTNFPEVEYGPDAVVAYSYENDKDTYQYLHAMYSFANEKGVTMNESTCGWTKPQADVFRAVEGIWDCYMLQDAALENCATTLDAIKFMGEKVTEEGWYGSPECIIVADGRDVWAFEVYGGNIWCAVRIPDDAFFFCANRCRIDFWEEDSDTYLSAPGMKEFAIKSGLWDGKGEFRPNQVFAAGNAWFGCTAREWRALCLIESDISEAMKADESLAEPKNIDDVFPLWIVPTQKISVQTIADLCSDHYEGTSYDVTRSIQSGRQGNPYANRTNNRAISVPQCTYFQISNVKAWLPEEARCLVYFGWGAPSLNYLTPVFASQRELAPHFGRGTRYAYDPQSGWWNESLVQTAAGINYVDARQVVKSVKDPLMATQYEITFAVQNQAAKLIKQGKRDAAIDLLTDYANNQANMWFKVYGDLATQLLAKYSYGTPTYSQSNGYAAHQDWWNGAVAAVNAYTAEYDAQNK